jgi:hypothetical protein
VNQDAIKALGSTVPEPNYDHSYWLKQHDANTPEWQKAKRLCGQTVLANYPNCLPVNDIVQADQLKKAEAGNKAAEKIEEMFRRGYQFDDVRKAWLPFREMQAAGCTYSYPESWRNDVAMPAWHSEPEGHSRSKFQHGGKVKCRQLSSGSSKTYSVNFKPSPRRGLAVCTASEPTSFTCSPQLN